MLQFKLLFTSWMLILMRASSQAAEACGPPSCKCVYGPSGLEMNCAGPDKTFDWDALPRNLVVLKLEGFDLKTFTLPTHALFYLKELRIPHSLNIDAILTAEWSGKLPNLRNLDLSLNALTEVPKSVFVMKNLIYLNVAGNSISTFPSFSDLTYLQEILIGQNPVTSLSCKMFQGMSNLTFIDMSDLPIMQLPACLFKGLSSLYRLNIMRTGISTILPGTFQDLTGVVYLQLNRNYLTKIPPGTFASMKNLLAMYLVGNYLNDVPDLTGLTSMEFLDLDDNLFREIPDNAFGNLPLLTELDLRKESLLSHISSNAFTGLPRLKRLAIEDNVRLEMMEDDVMAPLAPNLQLLFMSGNAFSTIKKSWLLPATSLWWFTFSNNPLICDCDIEWLYTAYAEKQFAWSQSFPEDWNRNDSFTSPKCFLPPRLRGTLFPELKVTDFSCSTPAVEPVVEQTVTLPESGVADLQAIVKGENPKTTWESPSGEKVEPVPWTSLLPYPFNLTVLPNPSSLTPPALANLSDPSWWRTLIPKPFDAFLPPLVPLTDKTDPDMKSAQAMPGVPQGGVVPGAFPFQSFIPPPFPYKQFIPAPFQAFIPPAFPYQQFVPGAGAAPGGGGETQAQAVPPAANPYSGFMPPPFPYKQFIPAPFQAFIPPPFPYQQFIPAPFRGLVPPNGADDSKQSFATSAKAAAPPNPYAAFIPPPFPYKQFIPAPFQSFIPPPFPYQQFIPGPFQGGVPPNGAGAKQAFAKPGTSPAFPYAGFMPPAFPYKQFIPAPFQSFIPPSFPYQPFIPGPFQGAAPPNGADAKQAFAAPGVSPAFPYAGFMPPNPYAGFIPPPFPYKQFIPAPFQSFIPPAFPYTQFVPGAGDQKSTQAATPPVAFPFQSFIPPPFPFQKFIPAPFRSFIPPTVPYAQFMPGGGSSPAGTATNFPFFMVPSPAEQMQANKAMETAAQKVATMSIKAAAAGTAGAATEKLPAPWLAFVPAPFRPLIPILPNGSFPLAPPDPVEYAPGVKEEAVPDPSAALPAPWLAFVPEPVRFLIPILPNGSFPVTPVAADATQPPAGGAAGDAAGGAAAPAVPWRMFIPEPFRSLIPEPSAAPKPGMSAPPKPGFPFQPGAGFPFGQFPGAGNQFGQFPGAGNPFAQFPGAGNPLAQYPGAGAGAAGSPYGPFPGAFPFAKFPGIAGNPFAKAPGGAFAPFKAEAAADGTFKGFPFADGALSGLPAPWMVFIPEPFRSFIPILPNGSFPLTPAVPGGALKEEAVGAADPAAPAAPPTLPPSVWKNFIPEPFRVFIPVLANGSFPAASVPAIAAAAAGVGGSPAAPFPWRSFIPDPVKVFIPITPKVGDPAAPSANDPVMFVSPSGATYPIPVFANGSFPWPPKPARKSPTPEPNPESNPESNLNAWLPYPLNETFQIPDFAVPWLLFDPPTMMPGAPAAPATPKDDSNNFKYSALNVDEAMPETDSMPVMKTLVATEAKQPDGSVLASLSASEPGRYVLHVKNGDKTTAYAFNVKKAGSGKATAIAIGSISGIALVALVVGIAVLRLRRNRRRRVFTNLLPESNDQFSYSTI